MTIYPEFIWWKALLCVVLGYLLGNLQVAVLFSRGKFQDDVREHGSGNAGSTNMLRVFGLKAGLITFVLDFCKGVIATVLGGLLMGRLGAYLFALATIIGHCWPVFFRFRGGKGVASTFGFMWAAFPLLSAPITLAGIILLLICRRVSVVSLMGATVFAVGTTIAVAAFRYPSLDPALCITAWVLCAFIWVQHRANIRRLLKGEEKELFPSIFRKKA